MEARSNMDKKETNTKKLLSIIKDLLLPKPKMGISSFELDDARQKGEDISKVIERYKK